MQNDDLTTFLIVLAVVLIAFLVAWFVLRRRKTNALRDRFGEEYDRTLSDVGGRGDAERNLEEREKRVSGLRIRPLSLDERDRYAGEWKDVKALFVDSPREAMLRGDRLLGDMMQARGFPVAEFDRRYEDLSVNHADVARHYRAGHEIADKQDQATTEEMRRALNHYEKLYDELVRDAGTALPARADDADVTIARGTADGNGNAFDESGVSVTQTQTPLGRPTRPD